jgi:hypothetical protein
MIKESEVRDENMQLRPLWATLTKLSSMIKLFFVINYQLVPRIVKFNNFKKLYFLKLLFILFTTTTDIYY